MNELRVRRMVGAGASALLGAMTLPLVSQGCNRGTLGRLLGTGGASATTPPISVSEADWVEIGEPIVDIAAGYLATCAVTASDAIYRWGYGEGFGNLGYGEPINVGDDETPVDIGPVQD